MFRPLLLALVLVGCAGAPATQVTPVVLPLGFGEPAAVDASVVASEPDVAALHDGTILVCALGRRSEDEPYLWRRAPDGDWTRLAHPEGRGVIDCALSVGEDGVAYYVTSAGSTLTVAVTRDAAAWDVEVSLGGGDLPYDRPFVAAGAAGRALVLAYHARDGLRSWSTADGGVTWRGPSVAQPPGSLVLQSFSNPVWKGQDAFAFAFAPLEPRGAALEPHDVWLATTDDAGATWRFEEIAPDRGNLNNIFPSVAAEGRNVYVAWAESAEGGAPVEAWLWSGGEPRRVSGATSLMPRVVATGFGPVVVSYATEAGIQPSFEEATWRVEATRGEEAVVVAEPVHRGSVSTGGYGTLASSFANNPGRVGSQNSQELLHNLGATTLRDGRLVVAFASDAAGPVGVHVAEERRP